MNTITATRLDQQRSRIFVNLMDAKSTCGISVVDQHLHISFHWANSLI